MFPAKKRVNNAGVVVLQPPSASSAAGVVSNSHKEYVLGKTIGLRYVLLKIHSQITDAERYRFLITLWTEKKIKDGY